ncbi:MAG: peptidase U32 family protein [Ruminiclostridium sp.]
MSENKLKVKAAVRNLEIAKLMCSAGAKEIYLGIDGRVLNSDYKIFTFNGRFNQKDNGTPTQVQSISELKEIVKYCHDAGVMVYYTANGYYMHEEFKPEFKKYLEIGIEAGIDCIIAANFGVIDFIHSEYPNIPIEAGLFLFSCNGEYINILKKLGVNRIVLPHSITISEIKSMKKKYDMEIEIFGHVGGGNNCGRCMFMHSPTKPEIGPACRSGYNIYKNGMLQDENINFYDGAADCTLCSLNEVIEAGVTAVKIIGRGSTDPRQHAYIVEKYVKYINLLCEEYENKEDIFSEIFRDDQKGRAFWKKSFCTRERCKLRPTKITNSYII